MNDELRMTNDELKRTYRQQSGLDHRVWFNSSLVISSLVIFVGGVEWTRMQTKP
jgi:hypothetical protein